MSCSVQLKVKPISTNKILVLRKYSPRLFPNKEDLIVVDLDLEFQVGIEQVMIQPYLN